ncbi:adenylate/guanylate cyclase domain-containing protein [Nostoc sp. FACHB-152]|uniref:CHASE2 domain-containing protein n=1 Tax=unclassified Nostoc TaxID=2593658 RepID=UPI001687ACB8|nr:MULTISPECIES: adenylate/guanylate cyclase domain-containing protein [unclassified Nostoc]MBD2448124.1 adenylate/guanylate cyclase domain-containing protein [Nostoc sp. FACHB-152]MBD2467128.1 adenylate/guanylate cyclase domain-containing protein [Nostoc sp. FACHB-145]
MWKNIKQLTWKFRGVIVAAPTITGLLILLRISGLMQGWEWQAFDQFVRLSPPLTQDKRIIIVEVTESDLQKYGFPLSDKLITKLLEKIKAQQPQAIGLDIYRDLPVGEETAKLNKLFVSTPNLVGIQKVGIPSVAPPAKLKQLGQVAANDILLDADGKLRRGLLSLPDKKGEEILTLGMNLAIQYLQNQGINPEITPDNRIKLGKTIFNKLQKNDGIYINLDTGGYQVLLKSYRPAGSFNKVSVQQVLEDKISQSLFKNRIILIGSTAESLGDFIPTPYSTLQQTPGVEVHAQLTSAIITQVLDKPLVIQVWNDKWEYLWICSWGFIGAVLVWRKRNHQVRSFLDRVKVFISLLIAANILILSAYLAFLNHYYIPLIPAIIAFLSSAIAVMGYLSQTAADMRKTLGRYLTDDVVTSLLENPEGLNLVGEKRKVTTLISDIRGFTSLSEKLPPEEVVKFLNLYLSVMNKIIKKYGGTINDIMGDGLVIFFGAPIQKLDDTERAVACAVAMQQAMETVNQKNRELNLPQLQMGIGINTGEVVVGNIGSEEHIKYTAIGSHVNLASRIESCTTGGQILISETTYNEISDIIKFKGKIETFMKGFDSAVTLYDVEGITGNFNLFLLEEIEDFINLKEPLLLKFTLLEGKQLSQDEFVGQLIQFSSQSGLIVADKIPNALTNIKLTILDLDTQDLLAEIYGKVTNKVVENNIGFYIKFTNLTPQIESVISRQGSKIC